MFSFRLLCIDHGFDGIGNPVIRLYGNTLNTSEACLVIAHGAFPYFYVKFDSSAVLKKLLQGIFNERDVRVHDALVFALDFYGYHENEESFVKISLRDPALKKSVLNFLSSFNYTIYEAHVSYYLQFMIDHSLIGNGEIILEGEFQVEQERISSCSSTFEINIRHTCIKGSGNSSEKNSSLSEYLRNEGIFSIPQISQERIEHNELGFVNKSKLLDHFMRRIGIPTNEFLHDMSVFSGKSYDATPALLNENICHNEGTTQNEHSFRIKGRSSNINSDSSLKCSENLIIQGVNYKNCLSYNILPPCANELMSSLFRKYGKPLNAYNAPYIESQVQTTQVSHSYCRSALSVRNDIKTVEIVSSQSLASVKSATIWTPAILPPLLKNTIVENTYCIPEKANPSENIIKTSGNNDKLRILSLEVFCESRGDLLPNPKYDKILIVFCCYTFDFELNHQNFVISPTFVTQGHSTFYFKNEIEFFEAFIHWFCEIINPDVVIGYDFILGSLGFLNDRYKHLCSNTTKINLYDHLSRIKTKAATETAPDTEYDCSDSNEENSSDNLSYSESENESDPISADEVDSNITNNSLKTVPGRINIDLWRILRNEVTTLRDYEFETAAFEVLRLKLSKFPNAKLMSWWNGSLKHKVCEYFEIRASLNIKMLFQINFINQTCELSRIFGIDFMSVFNRGSQFRVESLMIRLCKIYNFLVYSPTGVQVAKMNAPEIVPLVMEPLSEYHSDPVLVLDFQSLYPSVMIAYNICYSTCLGSLIATDNSRLGCYNFKQPYFNINQNSNLLKNFEDNIIISPNNVCFVRPHIREGILGKMLTELLDARTAIKSKMKEAKHQIMLYQKLDAIQFGLKLIANVTFGYTAANFSGRMPCVDISDAIVSFGRATLERAISSVQNSSKWNASVIYGDTDSLFVKLHGGVSIKDAFNIGRQIVKAVTDSNPWPVKLKLEKVYRPCLLASKKRYCGWSRESEDQDPILDCKGIETIRRDSIPFLKTIMETSLKTLFSSDGNISLVKTYIHKETSQLLSLDFCSKILNIGDYSFSKEIRHLTDYSRNIPPSALIARRRLEIDPRDIVHPKQRVPFLVVANDSRKLYRKIRSFDEICAIDNNYILDTNYLCHKVILPALKRLFDLTGLDIFENFKFSSIKSSVTAYFSENADLMYYICEFCSSRTKNHVKICSTCIKARSNILATFLSEYNHLQSQFLSSIAWCNNCSGCLQIEDILSCRNYRCPQNSKTRLYSIEYKDKSSLMENLF